MLKKIMVYTFLLIFTGCLYQNSDNEVLINSNELLDENVSFQYAIFYEEDLKAKFEDIKEIISENFDFEINNEESIHNVNIEISNDIYSDYTPPPEEYLRFLSIGFNQQDKQRYLNVDRAIILDFTFKNTESYINQKKAMEVIYYCSKEFNGYIWDDETRKLYTQDYFKENILTSWEDKTVIIPPNITIHQYQETDYIRSITLGMKKFGLPDIIIEESTRNEASTTVNIINIISQFISENCNLSIKGNILVDLNKLRTSSFKKEQLNSLIEEGTGKGKIYIEYGEPDDGDPDNRLWSIFFVSYQKTNSIKNQSNFYIDFFGSDDEAVLVKHEKELLDASQAAKKKLPHIKNIFNNSLGLAELILVKAPFKTDDGGNEWMWVEVIKWDSNEIIGNLQNDPQFIHTLKSGQEVIVFEKDIFDYLYYKNDGTFEGNETGKIIEKMYQ